MEFVDTHTHLDDDAFDDDLDEVIAQSRAKGVIRWINVGYNERRWKSTRALAQRITGMSIMLGLHPGDADDWSDELGDRLIDSIRESSPAAVGEIGLDLYWRQDNLRTQEDAFRAQLDIARQFDLPAVIHMRAADEPLLDVLDGIQALPHIHFHSFDGADGLRDWVLRNDASIGVGGLITRKGSESLREWVSGVPHDIVVLETDSPYLKPRGIRGTRNQPAYIPKVAALFAELWEQDQESIAEITSQNAERIFRLTESPTP